MHSTDRFSSQAEVESLGIGSTLYSFDLNRRTYDKSGGGPPVYEKHFEAEEIVSETKISWVMKSGGKVNKKTLSCPTAYGFSGYFTESAMRANIWQHEHRYKIERLVGRASFEQLKAIAEIIGYNSGENHGSKHRA